MMGAPKGNQFWKQRSKHGRDKLFASPELLMKAVEEYLAYIDNSPWIKNEAVKSGDYTGQIVSVPTTRPYTLSGLCLYLGCNRGYFWDFKKTCSKDFSEVVTRIEEIIETQQVEGAMVGAFNPNLTARLNGISDKQAVELTGKDGEKLDFRPQIIHTGVHPAGSEKDVDVDSRQ